MIILKNSFGDFIYLDVVTQYSQNFSSQISQHPVDGSGTVSDHVIKQNPKLQITGFISGADFNTSKPELKPEDRAFIGVDQVVVDSDIAQAVSVSYEENPYELLPDVAGQFFTDTLPEIDNISEGRSSLYSEKILFGVLQNFYTRREELTIYEFDNGVVVEEIPEVFITNLSISESAQTGDALQFNITLEQITFTSLLEAEIPEDVQQSFEKQNEEKVNKGGKTATDVTSTTDTSDGTALFTRVVGG